MKKVLSFSLFLMLGLAASQYLPSAMGAEYETLKDNITTPLLYICLAFIMINVGREFEIDKTRWRSYTTDYFVAMATAALPWILIACYYVFALLPLDLWSNYMAWKESLLLSRFAAPTSAGILFTMLASLNLSKSWIYKKIQVLAIFDDLDTILLMIPLQIMMIGMRWQMVAMVTIVVLLLIIGWKKLNTYNVPQDWKSIIIYSIIIFGITHALYIITKKLMGAENSIHVEVLLPAFVAGMVMKPKHSDSPIELKVSSFISFLFMFLVGMSMPLVIGVMDGAGAADAVELTSIISTVPMMSWGEIAFHVAMVSILSNLGKLMPVFFYRDRRMSERLAVSVGMFTRGEVGAGVIFIAISYNLGGNALIISALTLVVNLILTGGFVIWVRQLALRSYDPNAVEEAN